MFDHAAFGVRIASDIELIDIPGGRGDPEVAIVWASDRCKAPVDQAVDANYTIEIQDGNVILNWKDIGIFSISEGREIIVQTMPGVDLVHVRQILQNIALGIVLHQRGLYTLHGSAVCVNGKAAVFVGWKGAGKSTTASALYAKGHTLITDDVVAIDGACSGSHLIYPGIPTVKLWPEAVAAALKEDPEALPQIFEQTQKRARSIADRFSNHAVPLGCIYLLDYTSEEDDDLSIEPIAPAEALIELVRQSYALRFLGNKGASAYHLKQSRQLVQQVPVCRLRRPRALGRLADLVSAIEFDLAGRKSPVLVA